MDTKPSEKLAILFERRLNKKWEKRGIKEVPFITIRDGRCVTVTSDPKAIGEFTPVQRKLVFEDVDHAVRYSAMGLSRLPYKVWINFLGPENEVLRKYKLNDRKGGIDMDTDEYHSNPHEVGIAFTIKFIRKKARGNLPSEFQQ